MRYSTLFTKTSKTVSADEVAKNAQLLMRAGFVYKVMAGVYAYTTLGLRILEKIRGIVREEMNAVGGQEILMSSLQRKETWEGTGRWDDKAVDVWFKSKLKDGTDIGFGWSHEEAILEMMQQFVESYKDLPISVYQFQTKLRNELRAKSGIMRGREFIMKDMYSLHATQEDMDAYYNKVTEAYKRCYERMGLGDSTYVTFASGGAFTKFSHEFQTICDAGEDILFVNDERTVAVNEEVLEDASNELGVDRSTLKPVKSAEVGNIFKFGTEKSEKMGITFTDQDGTRKPIYLASYGIGITRTMGVIVEKFADDRGMVWPQSVAPFHVHLVSLRSKDEAIQSQIDQTAQGLHDQLTTEGIEVLWDDRAGISPGEKFGDADLIGIPLRLVVSEKTLKESSVEWKLRKESEASLVKTDDAIEQVKAWMKG